MCTSCLGTVKPDGHEAANCPFALLFSWYQCYDCLLPTSTSRAAVWSDDYRCTCAAPTLRAVAARANGEAPPSSDSNGNPGDDQQQDSSTNDACNSDKKQDGKSKNEILNEEASKIVDAKTTARSIKVVDIDESSSPFANSALRDNPRARVLDMQCDGLVYLKKRLGEVMPGRLLSLTGPAVWATEIPVVHRPTQEEFWNRFVKHNIPVKITGACEGWKSIGKWSTDYLREKCGHREITVRVRETSKENEKENDGAEEPATAADDDNNRNNNNNNNNNNNSKGDKIFGDLSKDSRDAKCIYTNEKTITFAEFIDACVDQGDDCPYYGARIVYKDHLPELMDDIESHTIYRECFGTPLFAGVVGYIGAGGNTTPNHVDYYDNFFNVVAGSKEVTLFHPSYADLLRPRTYGYNYSSIPPGADPADHPLFKYAKSISITVHAGESLYLPYGWWHIVKGNDFNVIVNYWYEMRPEKREMHEKSIAFEQQYFKPPEEAEKASDN